MTAGRISRSLVAVLLIFCASATVASAQSAAPAQIFAPGVISGPADDGAPAFSPDENTILFTRGGAHWSSILESHRTGDTWSEPKIAAFSGEWSDLQPAFSPDGTFLVFASMRPASETTTARSEGLWRVERKNSGWSKPVRLPETVNIGPQVFKPTVAADGSIYFMAKIGKDKFRLYRSQLTNGTYEIAKPLSFSSGQTNDVDPEVAPDETFLIFSSSDRRPGDDSQEHLYIVFKNNGGWGQVTPIRFEGDSANGGGDENEAHLSPDRRTLYFCSNRTLAATFPRTREQAEKDLARVQMWDNGNNNVWFISLAPWLNAARSGHST